MFAPLCFVTCTMFNIVVANATCKGLEEIEEDDGEDELEISSDVRFASLRSEKVNLHVGPGLNYRVDWVLVLKHMPVVVLSDFHAWRRIKLCDGTVGWVHKSLLCAKKTILLRRSTWLRKSDTPSSRRLAHVGKNVVAYVVKRRKEWVKVMVKTPEEDSLTGWFPEKEVWGLS